MGYKYRVVEIGEYVLIIQREKNICFKMKKKEFEEEGDIKIREIKKCERNMMGHFLRIKNR